MEGDTEREIDNQACAWPGTPWWMLRPAPAGPASRVPLGQTSAAPLSGLLWCPHLVDKQTWSQGHIDCAHPLGTSHCGTVQPTASGSHSRALLKPHKGMCSGVCVWNNETLQSLSTPPGAMMLSLAALKSSPLTSLVQVLLQPSDASSSVSLTGSVSFHHLLKHHPRFHPWLSHSALNPTHKWLPSSHVQTKPSPNT